MDREHAVQAALAEVADAVAKLAVATGSAWSQPDAGSREAVRQGATLLAGLESAWLALVRDLDTRPEAVAGARAGHVARTFLVHALNRGTRQAGADVRAARALEAGRPCTDGGMPALAAAFAAGETSRRHVDAAVRVGSELPGHLVDRMDDDGRTGAERVDEFLAEQAKDASPEALAATGRQLLAVLDPDREDWFDPNAYTRRSLSMTLAPDGMLVGRFQLPAAQAAVVRAALEALATPAPATEHPDEDGQAVLVPDGRTRGQRLADALTAAARAALAQLNEGRSVPAQVVVLTDLDQLAHARAATDPRTADTGSAGTGSADGGVPAAASAGPGLAHCTATGPLSPAALALLSCDAHLRAAVIGPAGALLHLGRSRRTVSPSQRLALIARDRGCVIPGCIAEAAACDGHHAVWWRHGGRTDLDQLALLCPRHHDDVHHGVWELRMRDGIPWARPPSWVDPARPWLRNADRHPLRRARSLGEQLRLDLPDR